MDKKAKEALIQKFTKASNTDRPVAIKNNGAPLAVIYPVGDPHKFQVERDQQFQKLKIELKHLLIFIRSRINQLPEEVEAQLTSRRQEIEAALHKPDDTF
jgi:hypothetical protein